MGRKGRDHVVDRHDVRRQGKRLEEIYDEAIEAYR